MHKTLPQKGRPERSFATAFILVFLAVSLFLLSGGCAWIRKDTQPVAAVNPVNIKLAPDLASGPEGWRNEWPDREWWAVYGDSQLNALVKQAIGGSPNLAIVRKRADLASAKAALTEAGHGPALGLSAFVMRQHVSDAGFLGAFAENKPLLGLTGPWYTSATGGFVGKWDIDIWGKNRSQVEAALGAHAASVAEAAQAELVTSTTVVTLYYDLQILFALRDIQNELLAIEKLTLAWLEAKAQRGLSPRTEVEQARAKTYTAEQQIASTSAAILTLRETLRAMVGELLSPHQGGGSLVDAIRPAPLPRTIGRMPETLQYALLARRPDLQAARHYIEASLSAVDAAKAAFYPSFSLTAFFGLDSMHLDTLFRAGSQQFNLIGGLNLPIFDSGRLNANLKVMRAESDLSIHAYNAAVINAIREVSEAVIAMRNATTQLSLQEKIAEGSAVTYKSAQAHRQRGLIERPVAEMAKLPMLADKIKILEFKNKQIQAEVALIKSLGGGYQPPVAAGQNRVR